jgi:hypothetical protein
MDVLSQERGAALLRAHCRSLDPSTPTARERLEDELGVELCRLLVFALAGGGTSRRTGQRRSSGARPVLAA